MSSFDLNAQMSNLCTSIRDWALDLGFFHCGISDIDLSADEAYLQDWLEQGLYGSMTWMADHGNKRSRPAELLEGTVRVISVGLEYSSYDGYHEQPIWENLADGNRAYIARYALGRDYHKLMRQRLQKLAEKIQHHVEHLGYRVFVDSAPVLERALARNAGLGWIGKHTCLINKHRGSWFFLGEIYIDLPLPIDKPATAHCGTCQRCIDICPTQAITAPYRLDARRCIAYLTIEHSGSIPKEFRPLIGNRIFGCDDCQLICPWNSFAKRTDEPDFRARNQLDTASLLDLFVWTEAEFLSRTEGSPIRRSGYERWLRNIAVALGNAPYSDTILYVLSQRLESHCENVSGTISELVKEHIQWAIQQQKLKSKTILLKLES